MTPEKFRQWIVILIGVFILTVWVAMGMKMQKWNAMCSHGKDYKKSDMHKRMKDKMSRRRTQDIDTKMPARRMPRSMRRPEAKPAEEAK